MKKVQKTRRIIKMKDRIEISEYLIFKCIYMKKV